VLLGSEKKKVSRKARKETPRRIALVFFAVLCVSLRALRETLF
jgi:hypothetical protein